MTLSSLGDEQGLNRYLTQIRKFPLLLPETEYLLAKRNRDHGDTAAAAQLVTSHLRLVAKIAMRYRGYGLPVSELISEGNIGLMRGVKKFEPERGFRLATYATWWIKASIHEFVLRSWSLVKIGTTATQKRLFFNLRRIKRQLEIYSDTELHPANVAKIAIGLGVSAQDVINMNRRMMLGGDASLNIPLGDGEGAGEWLDVLSDDRPLQDEAMEVGQESLLRHDLLVDAMGHLTERERDILTQRRLSDEPPNLEELSKVYGVSRERIRQIEVRAFEKVQTSIKAMAFERASCFL
jgi:RNA polymerase sigma-32 factor